MSYAMPSSDEGAGSRIGRNENRTKCSDLNSRLCPDVDSVSLRMLNKIRQTHPTSYMRRREIQEKQLSSFSMVEHIASYKLSTNNTELDCSLSIDDMLRQLRPKSHWHKKKHATPDSMM